MSVTKRIFKNFSWLTIGELISRGFNAATIIYLARVLGASAFGLLSFAQAFFIYLSLIVDAGLSLFGTREIAKDKTLASRLVPNIILIRSLITIFLLIASLIVLFVLPIEGRLRWLFFLTFLLLFHKALNTEWIFQGLEKMQYIAMARISYSALMFLLVFLFVKGPVDLLLAPLAISLSGIIVALIFIFLLFSYFVKFDRQNLLPASWPNYIKKALPLAASIIFIQIYYYMDTIMLGFMDQTQVVGYYNAAYKVFLVFLGFLGLWQSTAFPVISYRLKEEKEKAQRFLDRYMKLTLLIFVPIVFLLAFLAEQLVVIIFGQAYINATIALQILIWNLIIIVINGVYGMLILVPAGKNREFMFGVGGGALVNIVLNLILIPPFSLIGAAVATLLTEIAVTYLLYYYSRRVLSVKLIDALFQPTLVSLLIMPLLFFITNFFHSIFLMFTISVSSFVLIYFIFLYFFRKEFLLTFIDELRLS